MDSESGHDHLHSGTDTPLPGGFGRLGVGSGWRVST
jgi:hypothetical protein